MLGIALDAKGNGGGDPFANTVVPARHFRIVAREVDVASNRHWRLSAAPNAASVARRAMEMLQSK